MRRAGEPLGPDEKKQSTMAGMKSFVLGLRMRSCALSSSIPSSAAIAPRNMASLSAAQIVVTSAEPASVPVTVALASKHLDGAKSTSLARDTN